MSETITADICVIGAGSGGLVVAAAAAQLGARTVLVERGLPGGGDLHTGSVPATALLAAGHAAQVFRTAGRFGIAAHEPEIDFAAVMAHVQGVVATLAPNASAIRMDGLGVRVIQAAGRFVAPDRLEAGDAVIQARRFVVATGSRPVVPAISGLGDIPYLTSDTVWTLRDRPEHLVVIGGGPTGLEAAQAFRRLGSAVTVIEADRILRDEDPEIVALLRERLRADGTAIRESAAVARVGPGVAVSLATSTVTGSHLLVAAGRRPCIEDLGLDAADVRVTDGRIAVDAGLRTSNRRIFALGDATGGGYGHVAAAQAGLVLRGMLFRLPARLLSPVPRVTHTDPGLAHIGLREDEARAQGLLVDVLRSPFADNHRAQAERRAEGLLKVVVGPRGRILGATILGAGAGDLIVPWALALRQKLGLDALAGLIVPNPSRSDATRSLASGYFLPRLLGARSRRLVRLLLRLP